MIQNSKSSGKPLIKRGGKQVTLQELIKIMELEEISRAPITDEDYEQPAYDNVNVRTDL